MKLFMVLATLKPEVEKDLSKSISIQKEKVQELMHKGILRSYSLSADFEKVYMVLEAESEVKVIQTLAEFPMISLLKSEITHLCFHRSHSATLLQPSLN
ncbi:MAG: hypothetical protein EYC69_09545 [Bacteroidetes bacterium]|nr:MAG: hypothetical protein EYC69_09545 [Bacteroidota bacterium]